MKALRHVMRPVAACIVALIFSDLARAAEVKAAVAANFTSAINRLAPVFEKKTGHKIVVSFGATGALFAQMQNGAPFDVFLAADDTHLTPLLQSNLAIKDSAFIYSIGRIVLWKSNTSGGSDTRDTDATTQQLTVALKSIGTGKLAIANPQTAPYGAAAVSTLQQLGMYDAVKSQFVTGENIAQTQQFVESGAAAAGFIALAQVKSLPTEKQGHWWLVPATLHAPINQQAMLLTKGKNNSAAIEFLQFMKSSEALAIIHELGYSTP